MTDVVLVYPPYTFDEKKQRFLAKFSSSPPLGLLYLASALEKAGITIKIIDAMVAPKTVEQIVKLVETEGVPIVGISATTPQIRGTVQLAMELKQTLGKNILIGLGAMVLPILLSNLVYKFFFESYKVFVYD